MCRITGKYLGLYIDRTGNEVEKVKGRRKRREGYVRGKGLGREGEGHEKEFERKRGSNKGLDDRMKPF